MSGQPCGPDGGGNPGQGIEHPDFHGRELAVRADDARQEEDHRVDRDLVAEVDEDRQPDLRITHGAQERVAAFAGAGIGGFRGQPAADFLRLGWRQPWRAVRTVGQLLPDHRGKEHSGQAFQHEHPLPALEAPEAIHAQQGPAQRAADDVGDADTQQEVAHRPRAILAAEPVREIEHHTGKQPRLGRAEQHAHDVEGGLALDKGHRRGQQAPRHHDACDPEARSDPMHDQVARDFQQGIAEEEQTRAQAVGRGRDVQVDSDVGLGEGNVGAIEKADHIGQHQQGHELAEQQCGQRAVCRRGQRRRA
ncbi:hypothetical protein D9M72_395140 [compost metagenome]